VRYADDTGIRITIAVLATLLLTFMIWYSKSRRVDVFAGEEIPHADTSPPVIATGEPVPEAKEVSEIAADATKRSSP